MKITISLAFSIYDEECKEMKDNIYEVKTKRKVEVDVNQNVNDEDQDVFVKQKIKIYIDKPKDEKLSRNAHNRAGA